MAKNNKKNKGNSSKYIKIIVGLALIIAVAFAGYYMFGDNHNEPSSSSASQSVSSTTKATEKQSSTTEPSSEPSSAENNTSTTKQAKNYELPLSINQALNALEEHYGPGYDINSTVEEDGINYFALYINDEKYASVAINLKTGEATETILQTNTKTEFYLV